MGQHLKKFVFNFSLFVLGVLVVAFVVFALLPGKYYLPGHWIIYGYFVIVTIAARIFIFNADKKKSNAFEKRYFLSTLARVILHLGFISIYLITVRENITVFIATFLSAYVIFTSFDTYTLHCFIKKSKQF